MHDQDFLNSYFADKWDPTIESYQYSGFAIVRKIKQDDWVLDVGCGSNPFKGKIENLVGIDPANPAADIQTTLEDYQPERQFDVALCLGSINFGTQDIITKQIEKLNSCLADNARVFWRLNPGLADHAHDDCNKIQFFPWTLEILWEYACKHGFCQANAKWDTNGQHNRLYAEWYRT
jgi:hypothetical protein